MGAQTRPWLALNIVFLSQVMLSVVPAAAPLVATELAPRMGFGSERVGVFTALSYTSAILASLFVSPWISWVGPVRSIQVMLVSAGLTALLGASGSLTGVMLASLTLGLAMGLPHPAFASLLGRHAPRASIGFFLSVRFAAAPVGIALAGLVIPSAVVSIGAQGLLMITAALCMFAALMVGRTVKPLDWRLAERPRMNITEPLREVLRHPHLRRLSFVSMVYAMVQQSFLAYVVLYLAGLGFSLQTAAGLLAMSQGVAVVGRIMVGHASDRWVSPRIILAIYGIGMGLAFGLLALTSRSPSMVSVSAVLGLAALTVMAWPGMMTAQLLRLTPPDRVAQTSSGSQIFMFGGSVLGPYLVASLLTQGTGYVVVFIGLGICAALAGASMLTLAPLGAGSLPNRLDASD